MAANLENDELTAAIQAVRDRVRARHPQNGLGLEGVAAADLLPLVHARDAAEAKVAAIGTVNPPPPGLKNNLVAVVLKKIARALDWHVRRTGRVQPRLHSLRTSLDSKRWPRQSDR